MVYIEYLRTVTFNWSRNSFSAGCFTLYSPGQQKDFGEEVSKPTGRLHFSGEHTSLSLDGLKVGYSCSSRYS
ncbi:FAD-dependent oxidoreductase [Cytobacillus sp. Sa5YUA1]|uniref:FAD-dependent oxidoreductase n=1 Tax=Cytobacillus stercorigallinarum TaxID=2762240 RepID=A0ABR8QL30_9BACI|nr:FAD-dependent oxidoreductase [Cytobacillus stercorigallinarum]